MTQRIRLDDLTSDQLDQLYAEIDRLTAELGDYDQRVQQLEALAEQHARNTLTVARERDSYRKAWKDEQQRRARAEAAIARVRALHYQDGDYCAICTTDFGRLSAPWPCPTVRALDGKQPTPGTAATQATEEPS